VGRFAKNTWITPIIQRSDFSCILPVFTQHFCGLIFNFLAIFRSPFNTVGNDWKYSPTIGVIQTGAIFWITIAFQFQWHFCLIFPFSNIYKKFHLLFLLLLLLLLLLRLLLLLLLLLLLHFNREYFPFIRVLCFDPAQWKRWKIFPSPHSPHSLHSLPPPNRNLPDDSPSMRCHVYQDSIQLNPPIWKKNFVEKKKWQI